MPPGEDRQLCGERHAVNPAHDPLKGGLWVPNGHAQDSQAANRASSTFTPFPASASLVMIRLAGEAETAANVMTGGADSQATIQRHDCPNKVSPSRRIDGELTTRLAAGMTQS